MTVKVVGGRMDSSIKVRNFLRNARAAMGRGQVVAIAEATGLASQRLSEILHEKRKNGCNFTTAVKIADALGISMDDLMQDPRTFAARMKNS